MERWIRCSDFVTRRPLDDEAYRELKEFEGEMGVKLAVSGRTFGGADVVVTYPRDREHSLRVVAVDPERWPHLAAVCEVRTPDDYDVDWDYVAEHPEKTTQEFRDYYGPNWATLLPELAAANRYRDMDEEA